MSSRDRPADRGQRQGLAALARLGSELRDARRGLGLSLDDVAAAARLSNAELSRIERGLSAKAPFVNLSRCAAVVGLDLSARLYPGGRPLRDAAHISLLSDLHALLHPTLRWDLEVPLPLSGDLRAWDALVRGPDWRFGVEAETSPRDAQALVRRLQLKQRDGDVDGVILAIRDTTTVRRFLADGADALAPLLPLGSRAVLSALRTGERPAANGVAVVPRRSHTCGV